MLPLVAAAEAVYLVGSGRDIGVLRVGHQVVHGVGHQVVHGEGLPVDHQAGRPVDLLAADTRLTMPRAVAAVDLQAVAAGGVLGVL